MEFLGAVCFILSCSEQGNRAQGGTSVVLLLQVKSFSAGLLDIKMKLCFHFVVAEQCTAMRYLIQRGSLQKESQCVYSQWDTAILG